MLGKPAWTWLGFVGIIGKIPPLISLGMTFGLIAGGVMVSLWKTPGQPAGLQPT